jgi:oxalate decarboxylase
MKNLNSDNNQSGLTRRQLLGMATLTSAGLAATSMGVPEAKAAETKAAGQGNAGLLGADGLPPLEDFTYDLEGSKGWVGKGGTAKEQTVKQLPVSKSIAGVSMRLQPGGLRELHWHAIAAEWAYIVKGNVRTTVISPNGEAGQDDFGPGDVWFFPKGYGHALQGLGPDETHFILGFDDGHFSEFGTFSITDWLGHTPADILSKNLGLPESAFATFPKSEVYIVQGQVPVNPFEPLREIKSQANQFPHKYSLDAAAPVMEFPGGELRVVSQKEFPITTMTGAIMLINPGSVRELHWHPNADEWQFVLSGRARVTIFGAHARTKTAEFGKGEVGFVNQGFGHYIEQVGSEPLRMLLIFNNPAYEEINLSAWLAANPASIVEDNFGLTKGVVDYLPRKLVGFTNPAGPA